MALEFLKDWNCGDWVEELLEAGSLETEASGFHVSVRINWDWKKLNDLGQKLAREVITEFLSKTPVAVIRTDGVEVYGDETGEDTFLIPWTECVTPCSSPACQEFINWLAEDLAFQEDRGEGFIDALKAAIRGQR